MSRTSAILALLLCACAGRPVPGTAPDYDPLPPPRDLQGSAEARSWFLEAVVAEQRGDLDAAERAFGWLVRLESSDPWAWVALGRFQDRRGQDDDAVASFERALSLDPDHVDAHLELGRVRIQRGEDALAVDHLARVLDARDDADAAHLLGRAWIRLGHPDRASAVLDRWSARPAADGVEALHRARLARRLERHGAAVDDLIRALDADVDPASAVGLLVDSARRSCRAGTVLTWAWDADVAGRTDPAWRRGAVEIARLVGDPDLFDAVVSRDAEPSLAREHLAVLRSTGRTESALALTRARLANAPTDPELRRLEAALLVELGRPHDALDVLERAAPTDAVLVDRVDLLVALDRAEDAAALAATGHGDAARLARARAVQAAGRPAEAEVLVGDGAPMHVRAQRIAALRHARGDHRGAVEVLLDVLLLASDDRVLPQAARLLPDLAGDPRGEPVWEALSRSSLRDVDAWLAAARWSPDVRQEALDRAAAVAPCAPGLHAMRLTVPGCPGDAVVHAAVDAAPTDLHVLDAAAAAWARCDNPDAAAKVLERAVRLHPTAERVERLASSRSAADQEVP